MRQPRKRSECRRLPPHHVVRWTWTQQTPSRQVQPRRSTQRRHLPVAIDRMRAGLPRTVSHSRTADHQALVAGSSEIAPPWKRGTARLLASGIAAAGGGSLAASETKCLQPGSCFNGDLLEIACSCRRHRRRLSAIRADVPAMRAQCPLWVISGSRTSLRLGPFYPRKRTNSRRGGRSASCQKRHSSGIAAMLRWPDKRAACRRAQMSKMLPMCLRAACSQ